jgi:hypothetical protein
LDISHSIGFLRGYDNCEQNVDVPKKSSGTMVVQGHILLWASRFSSTGGRRSKTGMDPFNFYLIVI